MYFFHDSLANENQKYKWFFPGRCARAGRTGIAYSLVAPDEYAYLLDLHLFLGKPLDFITLNKPEGTVGRIPQSLLEEQHSTLLTLHESHIDLVSLIYFC